VDVRKEVVQQVVQIVETHLDHLLIHILMAAHAVLSLDQVLEEVLVVVRREVSLVLALTAVVEASADTKKCPLTFLNS
jgi:hypothetical protein